MRRILSSAALALAISTGWAASASAGPVEAEVPEAQTVANAESAYCRASFSVPTVVREYPNANAGQIGQIPAGDWVDGAWCVPFTTGGKHTTCGSYSNIWLVVEWKDTWGSVHVGCLQGYDID